MPFTKDDDDDDMIEAFAPDRAERPTDRGQSMVGLFLSMGMACEPVGQSFEMEDSIMDMKKILWAVVVVVIAAIVAWQFGFLGQPQMTTEKTTQPPAKTEAPAQPPTTKAPAQPAPATTTTQ